MATAGSGDEQNMRPCGVLWWSSWAGRVRSGGGPRVIPTLTEGRIQPDGADSALEPVIAAKPWSTIMSPWRRRGPLLRACDQLELSQTRAGRRVARARHEAFAAAANQRGRVAALRRLAQAGRQTVAAHHEQLGAWSWSRRWALLAGWQQCCW